MLDHVVVDVEIARTIEETPGGWDATDKLGVAVACLWEFRTDRMRVYGPDDVPALRARLFAADRISGFNTINFDLPVICGLPRNVVSDDLVELVHKSNDLLDRIWDALGGREKGWNLNSVALGTLGVSKIGDGAEAPKWWQAGQVHRVINYCCDDVAIERDLAMFVDRHGYLISAATGQVLRLNPIRR